MAQTSLPRNAVAFGLAGLLPQAICLVLVAGGGPWGWSALAASCFYAAIILSFVGGLWWMSLLSAGAQPGWLYALAVTPSLLALAALLPWCVGWPWPRPSLIVLGTVLLMSPLADRHLDRSAPMPEGWLRVRVILSCGLGILTLLVAAL